MKHCHLLLILGLLAHFANGQTLFCGSDWTSADPAAQALHEQLEQQACTFFSADPQPVADAANPTYTFSLPGTYTITLLTQAANTALCDPASSQAVIQVVCAVVAGFTISNENPAENEPLTLTNTSQNATTFSWTVNGVVQEPTLPTGSFP